MRGVSSTTRCFQQGSKEPTETRQQQNAGQEEVLRQEAAAAGLLAIRAQALYSPAVPRGDGILAQRTG